MAEYPQVIINKNSQCPNPSMKINVTAEMWYDMMHHTHSNLSSEAVPPDTGEKITEITNMVSTLTELIKNQSQQIQNMQDSIDKLNKYVEEDLFISDTETTKNI